MDEGKEDAEVKSPQRALSFLEVVCKSSGKIRRFSTGTEAGFAVNLINKKLLNNCGGDRNCLPAASHIEAVREGELEEPISFGPNSLLVDYGTGWKLQTVIDSNGDGGVHIGTTRSKNASSADGNNAPNYTTSPLSLNYVGKILLAFLLMFVFGAAVTLLLENLPRLILYINETEAVSQWH